MSTIKSCLILTMQAAMRLRQDLRAGRITQADYDIEFPELDAEVTRLRALYEDTFNGVSAQQRKWMPSDRPLSHYAVVE